jgi:hypothetical protein
MAGQTMPQDDLIMLVKALCHAVGVYGDPTASLSSSQVVTELRRRVDHLANLLTELDKSMN